MPRRQDLVLQLIRQPRVSTFICRQCLHQLRLASTVVLPSDPAPTDSRASDRVPSILTASRSQSAQYVVRVSVLLSRPPVLTRELTSFEKSYFLYQRRLNERLALPFTRYFYYQRGTPEDIEWKRKVKERRTAARDIGVYTAYGKEGWNDELLIGDRIHEPDEQVKWLLKDAEVEIKQRGAQGEGEVVKKEEVEKPMPRITEADKIGDLRSLNRRLERTLYLVVKRGKGGWSFPNSVLEKDESLHMGAERTIIQAAGVNMNTWVVGNIPVGHQIYNYAQAIVDEEQRCELRGEKIFFMKARIMGGQATLKESQLGLEDYQWLTREEILRILEPRDSNAVKNILPER